MLFHLVISEQPTTKLIKVSFSSRKQKHQHAMKGAELKSMKYQSTLRINERHLFTS
jgi:hypothetical protein